MMSLVQERRSSENNSSSCFKFTLLIAKLVIWVAEDRKSALRNDTVHMVDEVDIDIL